LIRAPWPRRSACTDGTNNGSTAASLFEILRDLAKNRHVDAASRQIVRGAPWLKTTLVQCAWAVKKLQA